MQYLVLIGIDIGQHPQLFQRIWRHVLRFIDDQHRASVMAVFLQKKLEKILEHLDLFFAAILQVECEQDPLEQLSEGVVGIGNQSHRHISV